MKKYQVILLGILVFLMTDTVKAQKWLHDVDWFFVGGLNVGATAPLPFPSSQLDISKFSPQINPQIGVNAVIYFNEKWGLASGVTLDWKNMRVRTRVHDVYSSITLPTAFEGIPAGTTLYGHLEGKALTSANLLYLSHPLYISYRANKLWNIHLGGYFAMALNRKFKGHVSDVNIIADAVNGVTLPEEQLLENIPHATYNFSNKIHKVETGLLAGAEYRLNSNIGFYSHFTWALNPFFSGSETVDFTMRNLYGNIGVTLRLP